MQVNSIFHKELRFVDTQESIIEKYVNKLTITAIATSSNIVCYFDSEKNIVFEYQNDCGYLWVSTRYFLTPIIKISPYNLDLTDVKVILYNIIPNYLKITITNVFF